MSEESKIVYRDGSKVRVLRGRVSFDGIWVVVIREDGEWRVNEKQVESIVLRGPDQRQRRKRDEKS